MMNEISELVPEAAMAAELNLRVTTLSAWRFHGKGPVYTKLGRRVFYRRGDVASWLAAQRVEPRSAAERRADAA